jgi:hypothetical protein
MKVLAVMKYLFAVAAIVFLFISWKIAIGLFIGGTILHVIPRVPNHLLSVITGYLIIGGAAFLFFNWRIGICLIVAGLLAAIFRKWGNIKNYEYYKGQERATINNNQEESEVK